jgi:hypothetical protein
MADVPTDGDAGYLFGVMGLLPRRLLIGVTLLVAVLAWPHVAFAHVGAPYPVLLDHPVGPYVVSVLTDPDVGIGTFILQGTAGEEGVIPDDTTVTFWVWPEDGHTGEAGTEAGVEERRGEQRFVARVPFDAEGPWGVRLVLEGTAGEGEVTFSVQVTPPYPGFVTTLACLVPFMALGGLWMWGALRSRSPKNGEQGDV